MSMRLTVVLLLFSLAHAAQKVERQAKGLEKISYVRHQFGMELGSGYDSTNDIVLPNLIAEQHQATSDNVINAYEDHSTFSWRIVNSVSDVRDMLGIAGRVSLTVGESGMGASVQIEGHYMNDLSINDNEMLVAAVFRYNVRSVSIPDASLKGRLDCQRLNPSQRGSHFVRSITYGGELIASIKITMRSRAKIDKYGGSVKASSSVGYSFNAFIERMTSLSNTEIRTDIRILSSCGIQLIPSNITRFENLVSAFPTFLTENCPEGHPLQAELVPIKYLKECSEASGSAPPNLKVNDWELRPLFDYVAILYDDVRIASRKLDEVLLILDTVTMTASQKTKLKQLDMKLMQRTLKLLESKQKLRSTDPNVLYEVGLELKDYYPDGDTLPIPRHFEREILLIRDEIGVCPTFFKNILGNCYRYLNSKLSWYKASERCAGFGGYLASFNPEELTTFKKEIGSISGPFWVGLNRTADGTLEWNNEEPMEHVTVFRSEPYEEGKHCMKMRSDYSAVEQDSCVVGQNFACRVTLKG